MFIIMIYLRTNFGHEVVFMFFLDTRLMRKVDVSMTWQIRNPFFSRDVVFDETKFPYASNLWSMTSGTQVQISSNCIVLVQII